MVFEHDDGDPYEFIWFLMRSILSSYCIWPFSKWVWGASEGVGDPGRLANAQDYFRRRETEFKHGRVAMSATIITGRY